MKCSEESKYLLMINEILPFQNDKNQNYLTFETASIL